MVLDAKKMILGAIFTILGLGIVLFSSSGGGINMGNLVVGVFLVIIGVVLAGNEHFEKTSTSEENNEVITKSSKEKKTTEGNHVTIEEEFTTRKVKNESHAAM